MTPVDRYQPGRVALTDSAAKPISADQQPKPTTSDSPFRAWIDSATTGEELAAYQSPLDKQLGSSGDAAADAGSLGLTAEQSRRTQEQRATNAAIDSGSFGLFEAKSTESVANPGSVEEQRVEEAEERLAEANRWGIVSAIPDAESELRIAEAELNLVEANQHLANLRENGGSILAIERAAEDVNQARAQRYQEHARQVDETIADFTVSGDVSEFDQIDSFRQNLSHGQRADYDSHLEDIRNDNRINIRYWDGAPQDSLIDESVYRGIAAATFGRPELLDSAIENAMSYELHEHPGFPDPTNPDATTSGRVAELDENNGQFDVYIYPEGSDFRYGAVVPGSGDILTDAGQVRGFLNSGSNVFIHEFAHVEQAATDGGYLPDDFPDEALFRERVTSDEFNNLLDRYSGTLEASGTETRQDKLEGVGGSREAYATVLKLFTENSNALKAADPELFDLMVEHAGFDPTA